MANANQLWMQATDPAAALPVPSGGLVGALQNPQTGDMWFDTTNLVLKMWDGTQWNGCNSSAGKRVKTQFDKTDNTLAPITDLSMPVAAGKSYEFSYNLITTCDATGGWKVDMNGGTATATAIHYTIMASTAAAVAVSDQTALNGSATAAAAVLNITITGVITVNAGGTLIPQFAQTAANNTSSVLVGSSGVLTLIP